MSRNSRISVNEEVVYVHTWFQIKNHVEGLSIMRNLFIQARQIELVLDIIFIYLEIKELNANVH